MILFDWDQVLHCWNQTLIKAYNIAPNAPADQKKRFICICNNWVEAQSSLSQSSWLICSRRLSRWVSFSKVLPNLFFFVVSIPGKKSFIWVLLCRARPSRYPIKDVTRWWGSELQSKIGSAIRFEEMDTEIWTCFPIQVVLFVSLRVSSWTQIESKSKIAKFLKSFCSLMYCIPKGSSLSNRVSRLWYTFLG